MAKKSNIVEINGRKYNAATGKVVSAGEVSHSDASVKGQVIDGFAAPHRTRRKQAATAVHQAPQKTKKLHPAAVKATAPKKLKAVSKVEKQLKNDVSAPKKRAAKVDPKRAARSKTHSKSQKVSKFSRANRTAAKAVAVKPPAVDAQPPKLKQARRPAEVAQTEEDDTPAKSVFARLRRDRPKLMPTVASVGAVLLLVGYVTYLNLPNMALRVAASRAGFEASLPGYKPTGFNLSGPITYSPGQISVNFSANSDERQFQLTQRESTWDSQSLLDNFVVRENKRYVTFQESGLTVYVYDDSNATWVDGGIWYTIEGDSLLSSEQLIKIASSL